VNVPRTTATTDPTVFLPSISRPNQALPPPPPVLRPRQLSSHLHFRLRRARLSALSPVASSPPRAAAKTLEIFLTLVARGRVTATARKVLKLRYASARRASASTEDGARRFPLRIRRLSQQCSLPRSRPRPAHEVAARLSLRAAARYASRLQYLSTYWRLLSTFAYASYPWSHFLTWFLSTVNHRTAEL
jgi:hypothetical protein